MSEEEKQAIEYLKNKIDENKKEIKNIESKNNTSLIGYGTLHDSYKLQNWFYLILLNLIEKLQKENKEKDKYIKHSEEITTEMNNDINKLLSEIREKDKQIDLMAKEIKERNYNFTNKDIKEIKQYFEKRLE